MEPTDLFAEKRRKLNESRAKVKSDIAGLRERLSEIDLELGAIAAYEQYKERGTRTLDVPVEAQPGRVTRDAVVLVIAGESGITRANIIKALGVKGDKSGEAAVDNRLRDLKRDGSIEHEGRLYSLPG